jgi:hypothetical protein
MSQFDVHYINVQTVIVPGQNSIRILHIALKQIW